MASRVSKTRLIVVIVVVAVIATVAIALSRGSSSPSDVTLPIVTWNETTLSTLQGTPVVLNFWSISCRWCIRQLPYFESIAQQSGGQIKVIAINMADDAGMIQKFFGDYEPAMTIALDKNSKAFVDYCRAYNNTRWSIPFTLFVDSEGIVRYLQIGAFASEAALRQILTDVFGITIP